MSASWPATCARRSARCLAALQIGDITRQRIEHVQHGLGCCAPRRDRGAVAPSQGERASAFVHRLLAAQLAATIRDFHRDVSRIGLNVGGIAGDANEILRLRDHAQGQDARTTAKAASCAVSRPASARPSPWSTTSTPANARPRTSAARPPLGPGPGRPDRAIQNMRADVQMMALNTTLKCSRIGETGKPLGVIAVELRAHAGHLETSAARTLTALKSLSASADAQDGSKPTARTGAANASALRDAVGASARPATPSRATSCRRPQEGADVVEMLKRAAARFDFQRQVGDHLDQAAAELEHDVGLDDEPLHDVTAALSPLLTNLARSTPWPRNARSTRADGRSGPVGVAEVEDASAVEDDDLLF
jgi:hypothetical protein